MKRLPVILSFVLFIGLCAAIAYWVMEYTKPPSRPIAAPPRASQADTGLTAAAGLFGGSRAVVVASNYQLRGVVVAGDPAESVAILIADGKPAQAVKVGREILPGTVVKEVQPRHVLLSEGGVIKRVELPADVPSSAGASATNPLAPRYPGQQPPARPPFPQFPQAQQQNPQIPPRPGQVMPVPQPGQNGMPPGQPTDEQSVPPEPEAPPVPETGLPPGFPPPDASPPDGNFDPGIPPEQQQGFAPGQQGLPPELQQ